nr:chaperone protein dnaJ 49-like [Ipomoea trifida]GMC95686.1 chaperone protein DnaJ 49-like [Ipomoea batatas]
MDGNKDEALKCYKIAKDSIQSGNRERGLKFLNKAKRLDPNLEIDDLLSKVDGSQAENESPNIPTKEDSSSSGKPPESGARRRSSVNKEAGSSSSSEGVAGYTEEQVTIVREIKRKKDYYEILGLEKSCSVEDVRKAYRKLSLKVHPDKNKAPGSEEAFKMVSKAFQCLSDEENRKRYDVVGDEAPVYERRPTRRHAGGGMQGFNGFYYEDVDAEEIFRNFFFGGMNPVATTHFSFGPGVGVRVGGHNGSNGFARTLIQLLPVILILLLNFLPSSDPVYSFSRSYPYEQLFTTQRGVNYYVKPGKFEQDYPLSSPRRVKLEEGIEHEYFNSLAYNCRLERQQVLWGYRQATPNCDTLRKFQDAAA